MAEKNAYILGTDKQELLRLGVQHQIWSSEARKGWEFAEFTEGQRILDLGSGPGFASEELAYIAGTKGEVVAVDRSLKYLKYLDELARIKGLQIKTVHTEFDEMKLPESYFDRMFCRWALAWVDNPKEILAKVVKAMKPGSKIVIHEYFDWRLHQTVPSFSHLSKAISNTFQSFHDSPGRINIGKELNTIFKELNIELLNVRLMPKIAQPKDHAWHWPKSFYISYFPRLVDLGYLSNADVDRAVEDLELLEKTPGAYICCPMMIELVGQVK